jgi:hypothetical protein
MVSEIGKFGDFDGWSCNWKIEALRSVDR